MSTASKPVILAARRTPVGKFGGGLAKVPATTLGGIVAKAVLDAVPGSREKVDELSLIHI